MESPAASFYLSERCGKWTALFYLNEQNTICVVLTHSQTSDGGSVSLGLSVCPDFDMQTGGATDETLLAFCCWTGSRVLWILWL